MVHTRKLGKCVKIYKTYHKKIDLKERKLV